MTPPGFIHQDEAAKRLNLTTMRLRQIADLQQSYFQPPTDGLYDTIDLMTGFVRYMRDQQLKAGDTLAAVTLKTKMEKLRVETVKADKAEARVLPVEEVDRINGHYLTEIVQRAVKLGPSVGMLTVGGTAPQNAAIFQDGLLGVFSDLPRMKMLDEDSKKKIHHWLHTRTESVSG